MNDLKPLPELVLYLLSAAALVTLFFLLRWIGEQHDRDCQGTVCQCGGPKIEGEPECEKCQASRL